ncbi:helix-turn-helix transcriptional regulator [Paenibacillus solisilvae]|uniref:Helix-turn-helix transcriptional regulator n=1 Tax=Paenibacillus solisilvae TaxID=2486751 RepID=A0ABW0W614_9BACL
MPEQSSVVSFLPPPMPYYLECGKTILHPGEQHPSRHQLRMFDWLFMVSGRLFIGEEKEKWTLTAGQTLLLRPDLYHYSIQPCLEQTAFYWIHFTAEGAWEEHAADEQLMSRPIRENSGPSPYTIHIPKYGLLPSPAAAFEQLGRLVALNMESGAFWQQQQLFNDLLRLMDESQRTTYASPAFLVAQQAEAFLKQNYRSPITNAMLGEVLHFHPGYIVRCMKEAYRCTPQDYLMIYRVERAKQLLLSTELAVATVAEQVGFHQTPYFSACFRKLTGITPMQYRKQFAKRSKKPDS